MDGQIDYIVIERFFGTQKINDTNGSTESGISEAVALTFTVLMLILE